MPSRRPDLPLCPNNNAERTHCFCTAIGDDDDVLCCFCRLTRTEILERDLESLHTKYKYFTSSSDIEWEDIKFSNNKYDTMIQWKYSNPTQFALPVEVPESSDDGDEEYQGGGD